jgi:NADH:ubiquinone oxidoreductase subunit C
VLFNPLALKVSPQQPQRAFFCSDGAKKKKKPKYRFGFPMALYFFFEKLNFSYWTSTTVSPNHYVCVLPASASQALASVLGGELFLGKSQLVEATAFDLTGQEVAAGDFLVFLKNNGIVLSYSFYFFLLKKRITFFLHGGEQVCSVESFYSNANWLEREISEMFGVSYLLKKDSRNLLLDYGSSFNPFLKKFPATGHAEVVFNSFLKTTAYVQNASVEL